MNRRSLALALSLALSASAAACSHPAADEATAAAPAGATKASAEEIVTKGGTFAFSLDDSHRVASILKLRCSFQSSDCYAKTAKEAALEGVRFEKNAAGELVFVSYGDDEVYHKATFRIVDRTPTTVTIEPTGKDEGIHAAQKGPAKLVVEAHDDVVALEDPVKGKLVYRRSQ